MWVYFRDGFISVVKKDSSSSLLTVRARVKTDLDNLRKKYMPTLSETKKDEGTDYPYRCLIKVDDYAEGMKLLAKDTSYDNFKNEILKTSGFARAHVYGEVWRATCELEQLEF